MRDKVDICLFSETKLDETFPNQEFKIHGYQMYRRDRNKHGGGVIYVNENIPCKMVNIEGVPDDCEIILIEFPSKLENGFALDFINHHHKIINIFLTICHLS